MSAGSPLWWGLFDLAFRPWMSSRVRVHVAGLPLDVPDGRPLLLCANHESFWDGFLLRDVQRRTRPRARFGAVMLERELKGRPWLRLLGGMGLTPGSVGATRALLRRLESLGREAPSSVVAYFPQGRIHPDDPRPLRFRRGVTSVAAALAPCWVVPVGIRVVPGRTSRAEAFVSVGGPWAASEAEPLAIGALQRAVADELDAIGAFVARHGEDAADRWPDGGEPLPRSAHAGAAGGPAVSWISRN